ncbi:hypothetical protein Q5752_000245 [Cryptotrichosporon argae]
MQHRTPALSLSPGRDELDPWFAAGTAGAASSAGPSTRASTFASEAAGAPSVPPPSTSNGGPLSSSLELVRRRVRRPIIATPSSPGSPSSPSSPSAASRANTQPASPQTTEHKRRQSSLSSLSGLLISGISSALDSVGAAVAHPLARAADAEADSDAERAAEASRPRLREARERVDRLVDSASEGSRASFDLPRGVGEDGAEVEVIVHQVTLGQSAAGIALLYGIDVATLRKINKLWPSDPIHLRTHLYVPLEACKFHGNTLVRGPGEGQVSVVPKSMSATALGKRVEQLSMNLGDGGPVGHDGHPDDGDGDYVRILDIVRVPASQLRFFPPSARRIPSSRSSLESDLLRLRRSTEMTSSSPVQLSRRTSSGSQPTLRSSRIHRHVSDNLDGPVISNDLSTLPPPLQPKQKATQKGVVRLRPPTSSGRVEGNDIASRLSRWFDVPPPPVAPLKPERPRPAPSRENSQTAKKKERERRAAVETLFEMDDRSDGKSRSD